VVLATLCQGRPAAGLLFDLDGTLLDSAPDLATAIDALLASLSLELAGVARVRSWVGEGASLLVRRALAYGLSCAPARVDASLLRRSLDSFFQYYQAHCCDSTRLYNGVESALGQLQRRGLALACVTNKPGRFTGQMLQHYGLARYFPVVVSGDSLAVKKPDPAPLQAAAAGLGIELQHCAMVGDSATDILAARNADIAAVAVSYGYRRGHSVDQLEADLVVDDLRELLG
jgi:phosphoglycolate phosphatase